MLRTTALHGPNNSSATQLSSPSRADLRSERGVALLEFVLIGSLLLLLLSVAVDFARAFIQHSAISRIAFETARYAASHPQPIPAVDMLCGPDRFVDTCSTSWLEDVRLRMSTLAADYVSDRPDFNLNNADITKQIIVDSVNERISITITFPFHPFTPGFQFLTQTSETVVGPSLFFTN